MERTTFFFFILPFLEQQAVYDSLARADNGANSSGGGFGVPIGFDNSEARMNAGNIHHRLPGSNHAERMAWLEGLARISFYLCPTRRAAGRLTNSAWPSPDNEGTDWPNNGWCQTPQSLNPENIGPPTDYAVVSLFFNNAADTVNMNDLSWRHFDWVWDVNPVRARDNRNPRQRGPFRYATLAAYPSGGVDWNWAYGYAGNWMPTDDISWWQDGTSNQILMGEKYYAPHEQYNHTHDGTWLYTRWGTQSAAHRSFRTQWPLARSGMWENTWECHHARARFGSWHPGIVNFLMGDGAVRSVSHTTPVDILYSLGHVNDGRPVSMP
jgi:hypothetical protein